MGGVEDVGRGLVGGRGRLLVKGEGKWSSGKFVGRSGGVEGND